MNLHEMSKNSFDLLTTMDLNLLDNVDELISKYIESNHDD